MKSALKRLALGCAALALVASAQAADAPLIVSEAWARPTVVGQSVGGAYLRIDNNAGADRLLSARTDAAAKVELHSMTMDGDVMRMRRIDAIDIPAGARVELKPGALHLMLIGLKAPLAAGTSVPLTLKFEKAGDVEVQAQVAPRVPDAGPHQHHN